MPRDDEPDDGLSKPSTHGSRIGVVAAAAAAILVLGGIGLIGVSIASQRDAPQPQAAISSGSVGSPIAGRATSPPADVDPVERTPVSLRVVGPILLASKPVTLVIPSIDVQSSLLHLGLAADGSLEVPSVGPDYDRAAWYRYSPTPGSLGPAVLLGHVDSAAGGPSVFFRLGELRPGDRVSIARADGSVASFVVDEVHRYPKDRFPTELVYGDIDHAGLRIVTCGGAFDGSTGHYLDNIVVFASLVRGDTAVRAVTPRGSDASARRTPRP